MDETLLHPSYSIEELNFLENLQKSKELQENEYLLCIKDPLYWLETWVWTLDTHDPDHPVKKFPIKPYVRELVKIFTTESLLLIPKSRQMMISWLMCALCLWEGQFNYGRLIFVQSKKEQDADSLIQRMKFMYDFQPKFLKKRQVNPSNQGRDIYCKLHWPAIKSEVQGIPQGGDQLRMHTASLIFCIAPGTKILTDDLRWITAGSVKVGDFLAGIDENPQSSYIRRMWRKAKVLSVKRVALPSYRLTFEDGTVIVCSSKHRWLVGAIETEQRHHQRRKWIETERLKFRSLKTASKVTRLLDVWEQKNDWIEGYLAGVYDGEGCLTVKKIKGSQKTDVRLQFAQNPGVVLETVMRLLEEKGFQYITYSQDNKKCRQMTLCRRDEIIRFLGMIRPKRLIEKFDIGNFGTAYAKSSVALIKKESIGETELIGITTSTGTFVAEGLASHNSDEMGFQPEAESAYTAAKPTIDGGGKFIGVSTAEPGFFEDLVFD